jgi:hypothetical protein
VKSNFNDNGSEEGLEGDAEDMVKVSLEGTGRKIQKDCQDCKVRGKEKPQKWAKMGKTGFRAGKYAPAIRAGWMPSPG